MITPYELGYRCPQWYSNFLVPSSTAHRKYLVQFHGQNLPASCNCPAYQYSGEYGLQNCRHIKIAKMMGCFGVRGSKVRLDMSGVELRESPLQSYHVTDRPCPCCGEPMVDLDRLSAWPTEVANKDNKPG
jgi:hypothetical protein